MSLYSMGDIIAKSPFLLDMYPKDDLINLKCIYYEKVKRNQINADSFNFTEFITKLHELGFVPHEYHIVRADKTKLFGKENITVKKIINYQRKLQTMARIIEKNERHKVALKINNEKPFQILLKHPNARTERKIYIKQ